MSTLFVLWFAGFAFHLALFAVAIGWTGGIDKDLDGRTLLYASLMLLALAMVWPFFMALYVFRRLRGAR